MQKAWYIDTGILKVKVNDESEMKLADYSLSSSTLGLQVHLCMKQTDTQTFKTQAETANT